MRFEDIDFWRLNDSLSVTNAAMLAADIDPGKNELTEQSLPDDGFFHIRGESNHVNHYFHSSRFIAVFSAIRNAILEDRLSANITRLARDASYRWFGGEDFAEKPGEHEAELTYNALLRTEGTSLKSNVERSGWGTYGTILFIKEPDWSQTTIRVDDLKDWMAARNFRPPFFFPETKPQGFRDKEHERYSAKLAAAVSAWESVEQADPSRTVKQTLEKWLNANASVFGFIDDEGKPQSTVVQSLSEVANWETRGGAPRSGNSVKKPQAVERKPIENFTVQIQNTNPDDSEEVPF